MPAALCSVSSAIIHRHYLHCMRIIDAYASGAIYGTKEFKERVCIRLTGGLLTNQSGKSWRNMGGGGGGWGRAGHGLELLAFCI